MADMASDSSSLYSDLPPGCIRVLQLQRTCLTGVEGDAARDLAIVCDVKVISLTDVADGKESYAALSYVWGSTRDKRSVICNGHEIPCTANLFAALRQLLLGKLSIPRFLWVDAICINQNDYAERGHQVAIMGNIYHRAQIVVCWLGDGDPACEDDELCSRFWNYHAHGDRKGLCEDEPALKAGTKALERNPWFKRSWTLQEAVLAQKGVVLRGSSAIPWERLVNLPAIKRTSSTYLPHSPHSSEDQEGDKVSTHRVEGIQVLRQRLLTGDKLSLTTLLEVASSRVCKDPHDHIYSLLGLWNCQDEIVPSYDIPVLEVFRLAGAHMIQDSGGKFDLLKLSPNLPEFLPNGRNTFENTSLSWTWDDPMLVPTSWIPDFEEAGPQAFAKRAYLVETLGRPGRVSLYNTSPLAFEQIFKGSIDHQLTATLEGSSLVVEGVLLGRLNFILDCWRHEMDSHQLPDCVKSLGSSIRFRREHGFEDVGDSKQPVCLNMSQVQAAFLAHDLDECDCNRDDNRGSPRVCDPLYNYWHIIVFGAPETLIVQPGRNLKTKKAEVAICATCLETDWIKSGPGRTGHPMPILEGAAIHLTIAGDMNAWTGEHELEQTEFEVLSRKSDFERLLKDPVAARMVATLSTDFSKSWKYGQTTPYSVLSSVVSTEASKRSRQLLRARRSLQDKR